MGSGASADYATTHPPGKFVHDMSSSRRNIVRLGAGFVCALVAMNLNWNFLHVESKLVTMLLANTGNLLLIALFAILVFHFSNGQEDVGFRARLLSQDWMYLIWIGVLGCTAMWSISPTATLRSITPLLVVWLATLFLHQLSTVDAVRIVLSTSVWVSILSLVSVPLLGASYVYQPKSSTGAPELRGIFDHQLRLGSFIALAVGFVVIAGLNGDLKRVLSKRPAINICCCTVLLIVLFLSRTRLYVAAAVIAVLIAVALGRRGSKKLISLLAVIAFAAVVAFNLNTILTKLEEVGFDTTLTGRTDIWTRALNGITESSRSLGHGFGTFELPQFDYLYPTQYRATHAHSSYIQALFETGVLGLAALILLIVVQLIVAWRYSVRCNTYSYSMFLILYAALGSVTGLVYADARLSPMIGLLTLFLAIETRAIPMATVLPTTRNRAELGSGKI